MIILSCFELFLAVGDVMLAVVVVVVVGVVLSCC